MERKTKKVKKEGDTCRDCWTKRFRKELCGQFNAEGHKVSASPADQITPSMFLNRELKIREEAITAMRAEFADLYDEIGAIEKLAGDVYMGRYKEEKDKED